MNIVFLAGLVITIITALPVLMQLRSHPRGLVVLFFTETWERFSYYGMRALLIFYLTQHFLFDDRTAMNQYGAYVALIYLLPLVGGFLADRYIGTRKAVQFGAVLLVIGQLGLAVQGPPARQVLHYRGKSYAFASEGREAARRVRLKLGDRSYALSSAPGGGLKIDGLPPQAPLPNVLNRSAYSLSVEDRSPLFLNTFYLSLAFIIVGVGYLKPNISAIVGQLYRRDDPRRDSGFTLYYYGVNLGAFWSAAVCGLVGQTVGWWAGFALAGVGMLTGLAVFVGGRGWLESRGEPPDLARLRHPIRARLTVEHAVYLAGAAGVLLVWGLVRSNLLVGLLISAGSVVVLAYLAWFLIYRCDLAARRRLVLALVLIVGSLAFWILFEQAATSLNLFAQRNTQLPSHGFLTITAAQTQAFNPAFILIFAPIFAYAWAWLGERRRDPSPVFKFGLALLQVGVGFLLLVWGARFADAGSRVPLIFLTLAYLLHTTGELFLSPVGVSEVTKLAPPVLLSTLVAVWFLSMSWADFLGAKIAALIGSQTIGGQVLAPAHALQAATYWFGMIGWAATGFGAVYLMLAPRLSRWLASVDPTSTVAASEGDA